MGELIKKLKKKGYTCYNCCIEYNENNSIEN